jgi:GNAT superfamily N-acetyltransferase
MVRESLDRIPHYPVPSGYSVRWYEPNDGDLWVSIWSAAEKHLVINAELFENEFGDYRSILGERQFFLLDPAGKAIATSTAWFAGDGYAEGVGRIHWIAVAPGLQGLGLSKPMMTITCQRLQELGYKAACLGTTTSRLAAINLYCEFGFIPDIRSDEALAAWRELRPWLRREVRLPGE